MMLPMVQLMVTILLLLFLNSVYYLKKCLLCTSTAVFFARSITCCYRKVVRMEILSGTVEFIEFYALRGFRIHQWDLSYKLFFKNGIWTLVSIWNIYFPARNTLPWKQSIKFEIQITGLVVLQYHHKITTLENSTTIITNHHIFTYLSYFHVTNSSIFIAFKKSSSPTIFIESRNALWYLMTWLGMVNLSCCL